MTASEFSNAVFNAPVERCRRLNSIILQHVDPTKPMSVLDIGCGTGAQIFSLASELPLAQFIGVDISVPSIRIARNALAGSNYADRIAFHNSDYLDFEPESQMNLILTYSTLQFIPVDNARLFGKIASELVPGGIFINAMAIDCVYNSALTILRRAFRVFRGRVTDQMIYSVARLMHGTQIPSEELRERVSYMYEIPQHYDGRKLQRFLEERCDLESVEKLSETHANPVQMKHGIHVYRKRKDHA